MYNQLHNCNLNLQEHLKYVDALILAGIIDTETGKSIKQRMTANLTAKAGASMPQGGFQTPQTLTVPKETQGVNFENSEFLKARTCLLNYLKNLDISLDEEDMRKIEDVVLELEKAAIQRGSAYGGADNLLKMLASTNELAKERLATGAMGSSNLSQAPKKLFSRDEIAKMSTAEFIKNEPIINYQLQNGLI